MDDCFEFMSEPTYGFSTQITFECLGSACDSFVDPIQKRQSGDEFASEAPPDCRIIQNTCSENNFKLYK